MKIQEQRKDMDESAKSADRVRSDLQTFRNRSVAIGAQDQCSICSVYLLLKPFFIFPCGHKFHADCLEKQLMNYLSKSFVSHPRFIHGSLPSKFIHLKYQRGKLRGNAGETH